MGIPSRKEIKKKLGIKGVVLLGSYEDQQITAEQKKYYPLRENYWYEQLKGSIKNHSSLLFVCGKDHRKSFGKLLEKKGARVDYTTLIGRFKL